jgi:hypothetical protein
MRAANLVRKLSTQCLKCAWKCQRKPHMQLRRKWNTLMQRRLLSGEWCDFEKFRIAVGDPPDGTARITRFDQSKPHGPGNTFWTTTESRSQTDKVRRRIGTRLVAHEKLLRRIATAKTEDQKTRYILAARKAGFTYQVIGIAAGVSRQRVHQIIIQAAE